MLKNVFNSSIKSLLITVKHFIASLLQMVIWNLVMGNIYTGHLSLSSNPDVKHYRLFEIWKTYGKARELPWRNIWPYAPMLVCATGLKTFIYWLKKQTWPSAYYTRKFSLLLLLSIHRFFIYALLLSFIMKVNVNTRGLHIYAYWYCYVLCLELWFVGLCFVLCITCYYINMYLSI